MCRNNIRFLITVFIGVLFCPTIVFSQSQNNSLSQALVLFDAGKYDAAEPILKKLLDKDSDNLIVNYYYGACRTENKHYGIDEIVCLLNGYVGDAPLQSDYYLGVQYHAKNSWDAALKYYKSFMSKTDEATYEHYKVPEKMQMCHEKVNPFVNDTIINDTVEDVMPVAVARDKKIEDFNPVVPTKEDTVALSDDTISAMQLEDYTKEEIIDSVIPESSEKKEKDLKENIFPINFVVNSEITYPDTSFFKTGKGLRSYLQQLEKQQQLDEMKVRLDKLRKEYGAASSYAQQQSLGKLILSGETDCYKLQDEVSKTLTNARDLENGYWQNASPDEKEAIKNAIDAYSDKTTIEQQDIIDTNIVVAPNILVADVVEQTVDVSEQTSDNLVYKIQLGAYRHGVPAYKKTLFKKLSFIRKIDSHTDENGVVVYTTGTLTKYDDAVKMQEQVRQEGVKDAFVVPYFNEKRISLKEAKVIEAEK